MANYTGKNGQIYKTTDQIGIGGEGSVLAIEGNSHQVIKIYKPNKFKTPAERQTIERKLRVMMSMNVPLYHNGHICLAWPQDIVYDNGILAGFVMPNIPTKYKIYDIYRGGKNPVREKLYPNYTWKYSVQFAHNLAWIVDQLHRENIVIGDFNQNNIAVNASTGTIILLDCDSFDITDPATGEHFPCGVGLPEMLAPELQDVGPLSNGKFTKESDNFSLAIHIFRLLMDNADPFGGIITVDGSSSLSESRANKAIINGECAYVRNVKGKKIPQWSPKIDILPKEVVHLFIRTFDYTALNAVRRQSRRATAAEWLGALAPYGAPEPNHLLAHCSRNRRHVYAKHNSVCPWCNLGTATTQTKPRRSWLKPALTALLAACAIAVSGMILSYYDLDIGQLFSFLKFDQTTQTTVPYASEYFFPYSHCSYLSEEDLEGLTEEEVCLARNEIYARHGRMFEMQWIREYFLNTSWYEEQYTSEEFDPTIEQIFNEYEIANVKTIMDFEEKMGYR